MWINRPTEHSPKLNFTPKLVKDLNMCWVFLTFKTNTFRYLRQIFCTRGTVYESPYGEFMTTNNSKIPRENITISLVKITEKNCCRVTVNYYKKKDKNIRFLSLFHLPIRPVFMSVTVLLLVWLTWDLGVELTSGCQEREIIPQYKTESKT